MILTEQSRSNEKGQSIVGALVGVAIAGISMLAIMAGLQLGQQGQNEVKYVMDLDNFNEEMRSLLSDPVACTNSFGGKVAAADQSYTISNLYDGTASPGVIKYTVGSVYGDNSLKLNSMTLNNFVAGAISTKAEMTLVNDVSSEKLNIGGKARPRTINLSLDLDPSTNKIVNCVALAKMSDGIWQRTSTNVNNIFFASSPVGGNVGIGTTNPRVALEVNGRVLASDVRLFQDIPINDGETVNQNRSNSIYQTLLVWSTGANPFVMEGTTQEFTIGESSGQSNILSFNANQGGPFFFNGGNVGIGTAEPAALLHVNGTALATAWNISSDIRLKENVKEIENPLDKILQLRGVEFDWRPDVKAPTKHDQPHDIGVIAQEVEKVFPEAVASPKQGYKSVAYSKLIAPTIEAVKALYMRLTGVEADIAQLKARMDKEEAENAALKADNKTLKADIEMLKARLARERVDSHKSELAP